MRIGIDARMYSSNFTGIGRYTAELISNLAILSQKRPAHAFVLFMNNLEYETFVPPAPNFSKILVNAPHYSLREQIFFPKYIRHAKIDLMHFTHFNAPIVYTAPSIVTIHDLILSYFPGKKLTKPWHRAGYHLTLSASLKHAQSIIAVSEHTKKDLVKLYNVPEKKIRVIYEAAGENFRPVSDQTQKTVREKYHIHSPFFLYAGVWRDHKNLTGLIRAFHLLHLRSSRKTLIVITGKEKPAYPEVKQVVRELGLTDSVIFPGLVPENDLVALYNAAIAYVHPSFYEGFGLNILEAFSCGTPVASSNASCLPEIAGKGNALFFDPKNISEMADAFHKLFTDDALRQKLREKGLLRAKQFSWKKMAEETMGVYDEIHVHTLKRPPSPSRQ
ncbi:glycosyltransferase family 4 protein [Candidatus Peregrinibacteria bacterium]|nr:glycosyltransferase family 4 protein [Candidatus Peregrinibacteria bacterium]